MRRASLLLVPALLFALSGCDAAGSGTEATSGVWAGTAQFQVDTLIADQNFRVETDYETRYEFEISQDEDGLVIGFLNQYNTGTFTLREPRGDNGQEIVEQTFSWDDELVQSWPVYGTFARPTLELDLPEAESEGVFPRDLWTFTVVGDRARLEATKILHGYSFPAFENDDALHTVVLSPTNEDEFSVRRQ